jgi:two-component system chemotaxis response regulator CheY
MARVLVVNDAPYMRARCSKLLGEGGYQVVEAANGAEAVEAYRTYRPDGVLLDITTPEAGGMSTLQEIMKLDPSARVAMVTAMGQKELVGSALNAGAAAFVVKPFDGSRVLATMQSLVG